MEIPLDRLEFGFSLGLSNLPNLACSTRNHGLAYIWYDHADKFVCTELTEGGLSGDLLSHNFLSKAVCLCLQHDANLFLVGLKWWNFYSSHA